jgi:predicted nucleic acid-binding protein
VSATKRLLDTDILLFSLRGNTTVLGKWAKLAASQWVISAISGYEIQKGIEANPTTRSSQRATVLISQLEMEPITGDVALEAAKIHKALKKKGLSIGPADELIAAQAIILGATLVSNNTKHFEHVPRLKLENWL